MPIYKNTNNTIDKFKQATESTARVLSDNKKLEVVFGSNSATLTDKTINLPYPNKRNIDYIRGLSDMLALKFHYQDNIIFQKSLPVAKDAQEIYIALEDARLEAIGARKYPGIAANIESVLCHDLKSQENPPLNEALRFIARKALSGHEIPDNAKESVNKWQSWLAEHLGADDFSNLKSSINNQEEFAKISHRLIEKMNMSSKLCDIKQSLEKDNNSGDNKKTQQEETESENKESEISSEQSQAEKDDEGNFTEEEVLDENKEETGDSTESDIREESSIYNRNEELNNLLYGSYQIYTDEFDEVINAKDLCDSEELKKLRRLLDRKLSSLQNVTTRLANLLQRKLLAQQTRSWNFEMEEGILDSSRLSSIIANPSNDASYKQESDSKFKDTLVTILIDNSGSMRGRPIAITAMTTDILARTLEKCGVKVEILGFTTRAWKGGKSRNKWISDGKPNNPGRLNELRHIIYKDAKSPWRRIHDNLGLMLKEGLLKENIDGEALLWAAKRMISSPEQRKILMVISDGAPVDDSSLSANPGNYLEAHLRHVIKWLETKTEIQLIAIGIGHDVTRYYKHAVTISDVDDLGGTITDKLAELFDENRLKE